MPAAAPRPTPRSERTRSQILSAAEDLFAERGFDATRLEDVAERVGIRRASIVYYFRDKRELYDAVLADVFGGLRTGIERAFEGSAPLAVRIESAITAWVDYVCARPTLARLLLREAADGPRDTAPALAQQTRPFRELVERVLAASARDPLLSGRDVDPVHLASAIAGCTVFFVAAMPRFVPDLRSGPLRPEQVRAHREALLRITRRLLGTGLRATPSPDTTRRRKGTTS